MNTPNPRSRYSEYVERILQERPTHTKGGTPVEIAPDGRYVHTYTGRSKNGKSSCYVPCDYPQIFGWARVGMPRASKPPLLINHKGRKYLRLSV